MQCTDGWLNKKESTASNLYCKGLECDDKDEEDLKRCCDPAQSCSAFDCTQFERMVRKDNYENLRCAGRFCQDSDSVRCCGKRAPCGTLACPDGYAYRVGYIHILCENTTCTKGDEHKCCIPQEDRIFESNISVGEANGEQELDDWEMGARHMHKLHIVWTSFAIIVACVASW